MSIQKIIGILLIVLGGLGLAYGGFTYTKETHKAEIGPVQLAVNEKEHVNVPVWAGVSGLALGILLLLTGKKGGSV